MKQRIANELGGETNQILISKIKEYLHEQGSKQEEPQRSEFLEPLIFSTYNVEDINKKREEDEKRKDQERYESILM